MSICAQQKKEKKVRIVQVCKKSNNYGQAKVHYSQCQLRLKIEKYYYHGIYYIVPQSLNLLPLHVLKQLKLFLMSMQRTNT